MTESMGRRGEKGWGLGVIRVKELSGKLEPGCRESIIYASIEYVKDATKFIFNPSQKKGCKTKATQFS